MWCCFSCLQKSLPGEDCTSKSMHKMLEYGRESREAFDLEIEGLNAEEPRNRAQWAKAIAGEIYKRSAARSKEVPLANGEAIPTDAQRFLYDTLTVPDLASVEASFQKDTASGSTGTRRGGHGSGCFCLYSSQAKNSPEKMLAHQLAAVHRVVMDHMAGQAKRLNAVARCMSAYQQGLLTLRKLRQDGHQRISVQYVNVREGSQAVIGNVQTGCDKKLATNRPAKAV